MNLQEKIKIPPRLTPKILKKFIIGQKKIASKCTILVAESSHPPVLRPDVELQLLKQSAIVSDDVDGLPFVLRFAREPIAFAAYYESDSSVRSNVRGIMAAAAAAAGGVRRNGQE
ncbi:hypothetical protein GWI33_017064 [Rhynchophorus ferrugineus]|uniref:Uncharacterized protein n=1 Tax=Rhynchophorus ferrugineus TaxID=354439 RepID=A0A834I2N9_RHYFE|nr:hypothetical protein GWI33_017064 [Rhynchophorus ferrugineus]